MASAAPPSSSAAAASRQPSSPILEEVSRLEEIQSRVAEIWSQEVHLYETNQTRNHPNSSGTVHNETLFPYHAALYPLLDCYDSIREDSEFKVMDPPDSIRPSPASLPFVANGHRRSMHSARLDRHGLQIEELAALRGNLPNSAWAVRQLMPQDRKDVFEEGEWPYNSQNDEEGEEEAEGDNIRDEASRHNHNRFWNVLMDPTSEADLVPSSDASVPPRGEANYWQEEGPAEAFHVPNYIEEQADRARDFSFLRWWQRTIVEERRGKPFVAVGAKKVRPPKYKYSPEGLFAGNPYAQFVLLKVLKHSLSDLQRELRLARAVVLLMTDWRLCDDDGTGGEGSGIECLRRLLAVVSSEYVAPCGGYCHEWYIQNGGISDEEEEYEDVDDSARVDAPNHYCADWWEFLGSLSTLISHGITHMTRGHANVICALVHQEIHRASSALGPGEGNMTDDEKLSGKDYLKQNVFFLNNADYSTQRGRTGDRGMPQEGLQLNINLILTILSALRQHAVSDKMRLVKLLDMRSKGANSGDVSKQMSKSLESFQACVDSMLDIGERILFRLPNNSHGRDLGGMVVRGLVESYVTVSLGAAKTLKYVAPGLDQVNLRNVIDPLRYADAISKASNNPLLDRSRSRGNDQATSRTIEQLIGIQPPKDVQDIVKALFVRDLVDIQVSGCGYGDYLTWCRLPVSPEPLLFDYITNFPLLNSSPDEVDPRGSHWVVDEDGIELDYAQLSARYDFSLLVFLRQWNSPWTPESHLSFSVPYRKAVATLALCAHRYGVPHDITNHVNSFLPRSWWKDDRDCCWCRECQLSKMKLHFHAKVLNRETNWINKGKSSPANPEPEKTGKAPPLMKCRCQVAMACSVEHMKYLHQDGHKRYCGLPPFRAPFSEEDNNLCRQVLGGNEEAETNLQEDGDDGGWEDDGDDDDGSWESVDSNEEAAETGRSDLIFTFFNNKSYKNQHRQAPPFANFF